MSKLVAMHNVSHKALCVSSPISSASRCGNRLPGAPLRYRVKVPVEVNAVAVRRSNVQLPGEIPPLSGGQKSAEAIVVGETSRSADEHSKIAGGLTQRRAELYGDVLTAWRTVNPPKTPDGEVEPRVAAMGAGAKRRQPQATMWAFRSGFRPVPYAG
jgi:hypothetical protein